MTVQVLRLIRADANSSDILVSTFRPTCDANDIMADRFVNWPPPREALIPLVKTLARAAAAEDLRRGQAFVKNGRHLRRSFSPTDSCDDHQDQSIESGGPVGSFGIRCSWSSHQPR